MAALYLPAASDSLPPLGGRLFAAYRIAWWILLAVAIMAAGYALFEPGTHPLILGLRLTKSIVLIAVSSILFRRRRTDPVAAMLGLSFLLWTASSSVDFAGAASAWPILLDRCRFLLFAFALLLFPDGQWAPRWTRAVAVAILLVFLIGTLEALDLLSTRSFLPLAIGCVLLTLTALLARYKSLSSFMPKQQLKWVALGLVVGIALILTARAGAAIATRTIMPMSGDDLPRSPVPAWYCRHCARLSDFAPALPPLRRRNRHQPLRGLCRAHSGSGRNFCRERGDYPGARPALFRSGHRRSLRGHRCRHCGGTADATSRPDQRLGRGALPEGPNGSEVRAA